MTTTRESFKAADFLLTNEEKAELQKKVNISQPDNGELIIPKETKDVLDIVKTPIQEEKKAEPKTDEVFELNFETPLTGKKSFGAKKEEVSDINISADDSYYKFLLMDLGETDKDPKGLAKSIKEAKEKASKYDEVEKKATTYEEFFTTMPDDLKAINTAYISNQDYKPLFREFSESKLDYNKDVSFYKEEELVKAYMDKMPKSVKTNEWEDLNEDIQESAIILAKEYFNKEKTNISLRSEKIKNENDLFLQKYNQSIDASLTGLNQLDSNKKSKLKKLMQEDLLSAFYNKDGTYREDAAERLAFALYGKETLATYEEKINEAIERSKNTSMSKAREEVIQTSSDTVRKGSGTSETNQIEAEKRNALTSFIDKTSKRTF
jgi:hypothetical protein